MVLNTERSSRHFHNFSRSVTVYTANLKNKTQTRSVLFTVSVVSATMGDQDVSKDQKLADSIYEFSATDINGETVSLEKYKGHVCIIVNVASRCGHTKSNYEQFVELFDKYSESKGLRILAFPCNQFGGQEPGDSKKIREFAEKKGVKFDMFEKINVNGPKAHPLWNYLKEKIPGPKGKAIKWNFTKFVINDQGEPVERFPSSTKPLKMVETLEKYW